MGPYMGVKVILPQQQQCQQQQPRPLGSPRDCWPTATGMKGNKDLDAIEEKKGQCIVCPYFFLGEGEEKN